jgi:hypothetical protein
MKNITEFIKGSRLTQLPAYKDNSFVNIKAFYVYNAAALDLPIC